MKNLLVVGLGEKPELLNAKRGFLLITDDVPDIRADVFDPTKHSFNPLSGINERAAVEFAETVYGTEGKETLTVRNGKRALAQLLMGAKRLDRLRPGKSDADKEAAAAVDDILFLPSVRRVLCRPQNFSFRNRPIVARLNRAELGDKAAYVLGNLLIAEFGGQIIIPDFAFYARPSHSALIREGRLMAGVNTLSELEPKMRNLLLLQEKIGTGCTYDDAVVLAQYRGLRPDPTREKNDYNKFIDAAMA